MTRRVNMLAIAVLLAALLPVGRADAGLITNQDGEARKVAISHGAGSATVTIPAGKTMVFRCERAPCAVSLIGTDHRVRVSSDEQDVRIANGQLVIEEPR